MRTKDINIKGRVLKGYEIELQNAMLVLLVAPKGYIMCGYLNIASSDKFNDCAAIVKGVNSIDELLSKEVVSVSQSAAKAGINVGMTGMEAASLMI